MNMSGINARIDTTNSVVPTTNNQTSSAQNNGDNGNGSGAPCGACKFLRRKCLKGCVFAPYFLSEQGTEGFCAVHKVFGASNVSKLLLRIPLPELRRQAVITIKYEAQARLLDPIYGCVRTIFALERQVEHLQAEIEFVRAQLSNSRLSVTTAALLYQQQQQQMQAINYNNNATTSWQTAANPAAASCCNSYNMQYDDDVNKADWSPSKYVSARHIYSSVKDEVEQIDAAAAAAANYNDDHHLTSSSSNIGLEAVLAHSDHMCILDSLHRTIFSLDQQHTNEAEFQAFAQYALSQGNL